MLTNDSPHHLILAHVVHISFLPPVRLSSQQCPGAHRSLANEAVALLAWVFWRYDIG